MITNNVLFFVLALSTNINFITCFSLQSIGNFTVSHPGFISVIRSRDTGKSNEDYSLYISSFNGVPFSKDHVYYIPAIGNFLRSLDVQHLNHMKVTTLASNIVWPNEINQVPDDVFGKRMLSIAGGFLAPLKTRGSISLVDLSQDSPGTPFEITSGSDDHQWFYHRVLWLDMNGDGRKDAVTCRAKKSVFGSGHGELVWYEHPPSDKINIPWNHYAIATESDTFLDIGTLSTPDGKFTCIVTTGFFSNKLKIYWTTDPSGKWTDATKTKSRILEHGIGHVFDVKISDVNNDGHMDLLVTSNGISNTAVYVYQIPDDFRTGKFTRHTIMDGFHSHNILPGGGAPGSAQVIPNPSNKNGKPLVLLSGDDDSRAYILNAHSETPTDWTYQVTRILDGHSGTVGGISIGDVDKDGNLEIFVPAYTKGEVHAYKLLP